MDPNVIMGLGVLATCLWIGNKVLEKLPALTEWTDEDLDPKGGNGLLTQRHTAGFQPIEIPVSTKWPSETTWSNRSSLKPLQWPSTHWDDPHFGKIGRALQQPSTTPPPTQTSAPNAPTNNEAAAAAFFEEEQPKQAPAPKPNPTVRKKEAAKRQAEAKAKARAQAQQDAVRKQAIAQAKQAARNKPSAPEGPSRQQLEAMVAKVGLAGTVRQIMAETGWDFRTSAKYLADQRAK